MLNTEAVYFKAPVDDDGSHLKTHSRAFKVGIALIGGSCLVLVSILAISVSSPALQSTSMDASTNLLGLPASLRSAKKASSVLPQTTGNVLPGTGPWKELALAGIEASNRCGRDVSMNANRFKAVLSSMDSNSKATFAAVQKAVITKAAKITNAEDVLKAGVFAPLGFFDPLGISKNLEAKRLLFYREAEIKHGRVCMLASLGFVVGENFHPLFGGNIDVPSYVAFQETPLQTFWLAVVAAIAIPEFQYSVPTFNAPAEDGVYKDRDTFTMKLDRVPGDLGFDPLNLKPEDEEGFIDMQNKELAHGRLAMIAAAGMVAQELVTGKKLFEEGFGSDRFR